MLGLLTGLSYFDKTHILQYADDLSIFTLDDLMDSTFNTIQSSIDNLDL